ncbi:MAG: indolepyruvate oxidoreductase subunit beta [Nitrospirota bacterium]
MKEEKGNILFCGVGGQGVVLASEVVARALLEVGFDVKKSEVHGMARRGGSVESHVRFGRKVHSPVIAAGEADTVVAFELLESLRYAGHFRPGGRVIVSTQRIPPLSVSSGREKYPSGILSMLRKRRMAVWPLDAPGAACELGEPRVLGMVMVGALSEVLPVPRKTLAEVTASLVPGRFRETNLAALEKGRGLASGLSAKHETFPPEEMPSFPPRRDVRKVLGQSHDLWR